MTRRYLVGIVVLAVVVGGGLLWAGVGIPNSSFSDDSALTPTADQSDPQTKAQIGISGREISNESVRNVKVHPSGNVSVGIVVDVQIYGFDNLSYEDVQLCVFDENGTVLDNRSLGTISSPMSTRHPFNITVRERPTYYIIHHPELRADGTIWTEDRHWDPETNTYYTIEEDINEYQDDFEFPRTNETGVCG